MKLNAQGPKPLNARGQSSFARERCNPDSQIMMFFVSNLNGDKIIQFLVKAEVGSNRLALF